MPVPAAVAAADAAEAELASLIPDEGLPVEHASEDTPVRKGGDRKLTPIEETVPAKPVASSEPARSEDGKFAKKPDDTTPAPTVAAPNPEAAPDVAAEPEEEPDEEWTFTAWNEPVSIPGARIKHGVGVFIPETSLADTRRLIARGLRYDVVSEERNQLRDGVTRQQLDAEAALKILGPLATVDGLREAAQNPELAHERIKAAIAQSRLELEQQFRGKVIPESLTSGTSPNDDEGDRNEVIDRALLASLAAPKLAQVVKAAPSARKYLADRAHRFQSQFFVAAPHDHPRGAYQKGQIVFDAHGFNQFLAEEADLYAKAHPVAPKSAPPSAPVTSSSAKPPTAISAPPGGAGKIAPTASAPPKKPSDDRRSKKANRKPWLGQLNDAFNSVKAEHGL